MALGELKNGIGPDAYAIYQQVLAAVVERDHPVGSLYISENATSPAELYGGTWERIEGRFIMGASDTYPAGSTGGSATHTQTVGEMARHSHTMDLSNAGIDDNEYEYTVSYSRNKKITIAATRALQANGGNNPMNILNPYYSAYIWRRVA